MRQVRRVVDETCKAQARRSEQKLTKNSPRFRPKCRVRNISAPFPPPSLDMNRTLLAVSAASAVEQRLSQPTSKPLNRTLLAAAASIAVDHRRVAHVSSKLRRHALAAAPSIASTVSGSNKLAGAAIAGNGVVVFAPLDADCVGSGIRPRRPSVAHRSRRPSAWTQV